jgi:DNA primase
MPDIALRGQIVLEVAARAGVEVNELLRYLGLRVAPPPAPPGRRDGGGYAAQDGRRGFDGFASRNGQNPSGGFAARRGQGGFGSRGMSEAPWSRGPAPLRSRAVSPPTLEAQLKLLLAYHPALARQDLAPEFLPGGLLQWRQRIAALPAGSNFAVLLEGLKIESPEEAANLAATDRRNPGLVGDLTLEQAQHEYDDALGRLKLLQIRAEIDLLAREGLESEAQRTRYNELMAATRWLSAGANP